jgi:hypothetical protein
MIEVAVDEGGRGQLRLLFQHLSGENEEDGKNLRIVNVSVETRTVQQRNLGHKLYCLNEVVVGTLLVLTYSYSQTCQDALLCCRYSASIKQSAGLY